MAESFNSVRLLQHHLRQAGIFLSTGQLDDAAKQLDSALEIDPASLAALALRERLSALRASGRRPNGDPTLRVNAPVPASTDAPPPSTGRFVPNGVDAASWTDFEQRVQQRRFRALIEAGDRAVGAGDLAGARAALEEARELQPDSLEVSRLSIRIATIPMVAADAARHEGLFRSRTLRAASLLLLGVSLLMGLDWVRSGEVDMQSSIPAPVGTVAGSADDLTAASEEPIPASVSAVETSTEFAPEATSGADSIAAPTREPGLPLSFAPDSLPVRSQPPRRQRELGPGEVADDYLPGASPVARDVIFAPALSGEIPDFYVAPPRRDTVLSTSGGRTPTPSPMANVVRQPNAVVETLATSPGAAPATPPIVAPAPIAPAVAAAAAAVVIPNERARVESVLHQWARAYGQLDAAAVRTVWPSVDERALAKAFSNLSSQSVSFDSCEITVEGGSAKASCHGTASYVGKVGIQERRTEPRTVRFDLKRDGEAWRIQKAQTGR